MTILKKRTKLGQLITIQKLLMDWKIELFNGINFACSAISLREYTLKLRKESVKKLFSSLQIPYNKQCG